MMVANEQQIVDVYTDLNTSYSPTDYNETDTQEFSLQAIRDKLGNITDTVDPATTNETLTADSMPTQQTLTMNYQRQYQTEVATGKLSTKAKVAIICYVAAVLAMILGITLASVAVSGVFQETVTLNATYDSVVSDVAALEEQLAQEDFAELKAQAAELGYVSADNSNTQTFTRVETRPAQNFNIQTNWFDSLCDWLCGVFGG